jgi:hypothetical protein
VFRIGAALGLGTLLAACGGGGGGSDSDDSRNLRAALDRLKAGMNEEEIITAVGWSPNHGYLEWRSDSEALLVGADGRGNSAEKYITRAIYHNESERLVRDFAI